MEKIAGFFICLILLMALSLPFIEKYKTKGEEGRGKELPEKIAFVIELDSTGVLKKWHKSSDSGKTFDTSMADSSVKGITRLTVSEELYRKILSRYDKDPNSKFDLVTGAPRS